MRAPGRVFRPRAVRRTGLDRLGRADARLLPEALAGFPLERIVSSPYPRCVETVRALALARGLRVEEVEALAPGARREDVLALLASLPDAALACTHREVLELLFGDEVTCEKGGAWIVELREGVPIPVAYLPSPASRATTMTLDGVV
ncbi:MAG: histidine phosphatase family protein [Gaiellaceae bacterium]|nr:histidine phosphatase family protein [Gaiellaceae bacterium]